MALARILVVTVVTLFATTQLERATRVVVNGGIEVHYVERGRGEPVVLLHGGQTDYRSWQPQIEALSTRYRVIAYSRRYHYPNANPLDAANYSALVDAQDLAAFISALKLGPVHLVGTSYGAFVAMAFALDHPDQVRSLVVAEPPLHEWIMHDQRGRELVDEFMRDVQRPAAALFKSGDDVGAMRLFVDAFDVKGSFDALPAQRRAVAMANAGFFKATTQSSNPFPDLSRERARQFKMPVLVIHGAQTDELHVMLSAAVAAAFPNSSTATIADAGHGSPRQNPQAFTAAVAAFLSRR